MTPKQLQSQLYNKNNRAKIRERRGRHRIEYRQRVDAIKESTPCADCGNLFPAICMDFDHIGTDKKLQVSSLIAQVYPWPTIQAEIDKCELVCSNCHRIRTASRGRWKLQEKMVPNDL